MRLGSPSYNYCAQCAVQHSSQLNNKTIAIPMVLLSGCDLYLQRTPRRTRPLNSCTRALVMYILHIYINDMRTKEVSKCTVIYELSITFFS